MEKVTRKIKSKSKGIYLSVIILLFILTFAECRHTSNRRGQRPGFQRQDYVRQRTRDQRRLDRVGARARVYDNRRIYTPRRQNVNSVNLHRERLEELRKQRNHIENKIVFRNVELQHELLRDRARIRNTAISSQIRNGRYRNGGGENRPGVNSVQRQNYDRQSFDNRNNDHRSERNYNNLRNNNGENIRTNVANNRQRHRFVRPRGRTNSVEANRITSENRVRNIYSPKLNRRRDKSQALPLVQTTGYARRQPKTHFQPYSSKHLRQLAARNKGTTTELGNNYYAARGSRSGPLPTLQIQPTSQSLPQQTVGFQNGVTDSMRGQSIHAHTLGAPTQYIEVDPTQSTFVQQQAADQVGDNVRKVLAPLPSAVPHQGSSSGPVHVVSRTELPNGDIVQRVLPVAPIAPLPTVKSLVPVVAHASQLKERLGISQGKNVIANPAISLPIRTLAVQNKVQQHVPVPNTVQQNVHVPNVVQQSVNVPNAVQQNVHVPNTVQKSVHVPNAVQQNVHVPNAVQQSVHVPNAAQQSAHVPNAVQQSAHVPNTVQQSVNVQNAVQQSVHVPNAIQQSAHVPNAVQQSVHVPNAVQQSVHVPNAVQQSVHLTNAVQQSVNVPNAVQRSVYVPNAVQQSVFVPNAVQPSVSFNSWLNRILLGGEQPDSPDPTDAVKTVTDLVDILTSTVQNSPVEEEEVEWEDRPPTTTTTTTTTTPAPTTQAPTTTAASVIKSIAERIVSLLVQRSGGKLVPPAIKQPQLQKNAHTTRVDVKPTPATNRNKDSVIILQRKGTNSHRLIKIPREALLKAVQPTLAALRENSQNPVAATKVPSSALNSVLTRLLPPPTTASITHNSGVPAGISKTRSGASINLDDVVMSDSLPQMAKNIHLDGVAPLPYMSSNDLGGLSVRKIAGPAQEPGTQGTKKSIVHMNSNQDTSSDYAVQTILARIKSIVASQNKPRETTQPTTTTVTTTTAATTVATPAPTVAAAIPTCTPRSPNFRCKGKDLFVSMESVGAWCLGMCVKKGCIETVCECGCNISPTQPPTSKMTLTPSQRWQILNSHGPPPWVTTQKPETTTTDEPPEEEEWEPEDGTTVAPTTTLNPWWNMPSEFGGISPSPQRDFRLNPIDAHTSNMQKTDQHISELNEVAWASESKSRLQKLAENNSNSTEQNATAGGKEPPNWKGTVWHLPTQPPPKEEKEPVTQKITWPQRPLRDKWGRSERFTGGGESESGNAPSWNNWNNPWQMNPYGNGFMGDPRLSRLRFSWGGSGSGNGGGENKEADDR